MFVLVHLLCFVQPLLPIEGILVCIVSTPASLLIEGLGIDGLPVADTVLEWGVLVARRAAGI